MKELNLRSYFVMLARSWRWVIALIAVLAIVFALATNVLTKDTYSSSCSMYVMNITKHADNNLSGISTSGLEASQRMVNEYIILLRSDNVLSAVAGRVNAQGFQIDAAAIRDMLDMTAVEETALLQVTATTSDPNLSKLICDELMNCAPAKIQAFMNDLGSITPVDAAGVGTKNEPKTVRNAILGAVLGLALALCFVLVRCLMDNTIQDEKDLKNRFNVNVLGVVMDTAGGVDKSAAATGKTSGGKR